MKIGIDIRNIGKGRTGDEVVFFNLVKNLFLIDSQNEYILLTDRKVETDSKLRKEIEKMNLGKNFKVVSLGEKGINKFSWNFWTLPKYLRKNPVNVYQTQYIVPFFIPKKIKVVTIIHDVSFKVFPNLIKFFDRILLGVFIPLSLKRADKIVAVSRFSAEEIKKFYPFCKEKVTWAYNAIGEEFENIDFNNEKEKVLDTYLLPKNFILYLGTLQPRKNTTILIKAFSKISTKFPDLSLVLAGGRAHNFDQEIKPLISSLGLKKKVLLPGFIQNEDKADLYRAAKVFCFPSFYEGFGIPILEAFASKIPVIASRIPPHMEIAGNGAILFNPKKPEELSQKLENILENENDRENLQKKALQQLQNFSWEKTAQKYLEIYKNLN